MFGFLAGLLGGGAAAAATVSAAGAIGGQLLANKSAKQARAATSPSAIRAQAEAAGMNPLLFTNAAFSSAGAQPANILGSGIAKSASLWLDGSQREQELLLQQTQLEQQNARLSELAENFSTNPYVGGIYEQVPNPVSGGRNFGGPSSERDENGFLIDGPPQEDVPYFINVYDSPNGTNFRIINPELTESSPGELATGLTTLSAAEAATVVYQGASADGSESDAVELSDGTFLRGQRLSYNGVTLSGPAQVLPPDPPPPIRSRRSAGIDPRMDVWRAQNGYPVDHWR